jgi:hypothetical protein
MTLPSVALGLQFGHDLDSRNEGDLLAVFAVIEDGNTVTELGSSADIFEPYSTAGAHLGVIGKFVAAHLEPAFISPEQHTSMVKTYFALSHDVFL